MSDKAEMVPFKSQLMLALDGAALRDPIDVSWLHRSFCMAGLPVREPSDARYFARSDDRFSLTVNSDFVTLPGEDPFLVGVPWGARARLLMVWLATQARDPNRRADDRVIEIGPVKQWLSSIGITPNSKGMVGAKQQLIKLAFASFTMSLKDQGVHLFEKDQLIKRAAFADGDLQYYAQGQLDKIRWPLGIELTETAYTRFREQSVPIPTERLVEIANSPTAIDLFVFLCYRLPMLTPEATELVTWRMLATQFGKGIRKGEPVSRFKDDFKDAIAAVRRAYPEARFDPTDEGLVLRHSAPAELQKAFVLRAPKQAPQRQRRLRNRVSTSGKETGMSG